MRRFVEEAPATALRTPGPEHPVALEFVEEAAGGVGGRIEAASVVEIRPRCRA